METPVPKLVFIVPYRDRSQQQSLFRRQMNYLMEDIPKSDYKIYFVEQCDNREFNRGALKNIGFLVVKKKYPNDYKNITLVFNDVDTMPFTKNFLNYKTSPGIIKHYYGFRFALGGIVSITGKDFEQLNGFPNFWAWGYEDNLLQKRAVKMGMQIDRSQFYPIFDKNIMHLSDGLIRNVNRSEFDRYLAHTNEGWNSILDLNYAIDETNGVINVYFFSTGIEENLETSTKYDLRNGPKPYGNVGMNSLRPGSMRPKMVMHLV
jgi:hypothetical protein